MQEVNPLLSPRTLLEHLFNAAVRSATPKDCMSLYLPEPPKGKTLVLGAGKAAAAMALSVEQMWPRDNPMSGLVVTRYGHTPKSNVIGSSSRIRIVEAAHPVPDEVGLDATLEMLRLTDELTEDDLVIFLLSGGASALLTLPEKGVDFEEKRQINLALLRSGASISEMNCVRRHLSSVKGGRMALACRPAKVLTLAISDVPGDDPAIIGSGPTTPDETTCEQALEILTRYEIQISESIRSGLISRTFESVKKQDLDETRYETKIIATPRKALDEAANVARSLGVTPYVLGDQFEGEARDMAKFHAALAQSTTFHEEPFKRPCVLLSGGEATVTVKGLKSARGGRASEFCLSLAISLQGQKNVWGLAADTDGIDGSEFNAGAYVSPDTLFRGFSNGMDARKKLEENDSFTFFEKLGDLVVTGPTYTNVNDFRALLVL